MIRNVSRFFPSLDSQKIDSDLYSRYLDFLSVLSWRVRVKTVRYAGVALGIMVSIPGTSTLCNLKF